MKKVIVLATAALLISSLTFAGPTQEKKKCCKHPHKGCCKKGAKKDCKMDADKTTKM
jgi:hypothetical protein